MLKYILLLIILVFFFSCNQTSEEEIKNTLNYYLIGMSQYKGKDYNSALSSFKEDYKRTKNIKSLFKMSEISISTNDPHNAESYLKEALKIDNKNIRARFEIAVLYKKMGRYLKSIKFFTKLLDNKTYLNDSYYHIVDIYLYLGDLEKADELFKAGLSKITKEYKIKYLFAAYLYNEKDDSYKQYLDDILKNSKDYKVLNKLADFLFSKNDIDTAYRVLKRIEVHHPKNSLNLSAIGEILLRKEKYSEARKYFEASEKLDKRNIINKINLGTAEIYAGSLKKAEGYLKEAIGINPNSPSSLLLMGFILYLNNEFEKSNKIIEVVNKSIISSQLKAHRAKNQLIDFYLINVSMDTTSKMPNKDKIVNFATASNNKLLYLKIKRLNQMSLYKNVAELENSFKGKLDDNLIKELIIANIFLKNESKSYSLLEKLEKEKEVYKVWIDYYFKRKCDNLEKKYTK